jgi:hypothetical protein
MRVKLLPAVIFIVIIFMAGLFFLQGRRASLRIRDISGLSSEQMKKSALFIATTALLALFGLLFMFLGKISFLIALFVLAIFFLSRKRS